MHPVEHDSGYHIFVVPGLGSEIFGPISMIFDQNLVKLFVPFFAGDAVLLAGTQIQTPNEPSGTGRDFYHKFKIEGYDEVQHSASPSGVLSVTALAQRWKQLT